jgi:hypothetical protein
MDPDNADLIAPEEKGWLKKLFTTNRERLRSNK